MGSAVEPRRDFIIAGAADVDRENLQNRHQHLLPVK